MTIADTLEGFLALSVTLKKSHGSEQYAIATEELPLWENTQITALFALTTDLGPITNYLEKRLLVCDTKISVAQLTDQDWLASSQQSFTPFLVGENLWVCPTQCEKPKESERTIFIDAGPAFGSGRHETTQLCLDWLSRANLSTCRVLDFGAGSGILAIASLICGAEYAHGIDIDSQAVNLSLENAKLNGVSARFSASQEDVTEHEYDVVIANILANVILDYCSHLVSRTRRGGHLLLTGILSHQAARIERAFNPEISFERFQLNEWVLLVGKRKRCTRQTHLVKNN